MTQLDGVVVTHLAYRLLIGKNSSQIKHESDYFLRYEGTDNGNRSKMAAQMICLGVGNIMNKEPLRSFKTHSTNQ